MNRSPALTTALEKTRAFISPAFFSSEKLQQDGTASALLAQYHYGLVNDFNIHAIFTTALSQLATLHDIIKADNAEQTGQIVLDTGVLGVLYAMLDLLVLEGIYPSVSIGIGFPLERQQRSILVNRTCKSFPDLKILHDILPTLNSITFESSSGLTSNMRDSVLLDLIAANGEMAFSPARSETVKQEVAFKTSQYLEQIPIPRLYQTLTLLVQPAAPPWWKSAMSKILSLLPLSHNGVRHAIEFFASYHNASVTTEGSLPHPSKGPLLSNDVINHVTKIVTSVPSTMSVDTWFTQVASQLLELLDDLANLELSRVSATIITNGILCNRKLGSPGSIGWTLLVEPSQNALYPPVDNGKVGKLNGDFLTLTTQNNLNKHLRRLLALVSHPSPALTGRLLHKLILPLWALSAYSKPLTVLDTPRIASNLLVIFLRRCGTIDHLQLLSQNLDWNGTGKWHYAVSSDAGISMRFDRKVEDEKSLLDMISAYELKVQIFINLLAHDEIPSELVDKYFLQQTRQLLLPNRATTGRRSEQGLLQIEDDPLTGLIRVQIVQKMIITFGERLASSQWQILELISQALLHSVQAVNEGLQEKALPKRLTMVALSNIAVRAEVGQTSSQAAASDLSDDIVATCLSLINNLLATEDYALMGSSGTIRSISESLSILSQDTRDCLSPSTMAAIRSIISKLQSFDRQENRVLVAQPKVDEFGLEKLGKLADGLASPLAPERVAALTQLQICIEDLVMPVDVPAIMTMLLKALHDGKDEYVYLAVVRAIKQLAVRRNPGYVLRALAYSFQDSSENIMLDGRLWIGETLVTIMEALADQSEEQYQFNSTDFGIVTEICLTVASHRGDRRKELRERKQLEQFERKQQRKAERAWGGEIPDLASLQRNEEDAIDQAKEAHWLEMTQHIVATWQGDKNEEDIRIRSSALSIVSTVLEHAARAVSHDLLASAIDMALAILQIEDGDGKAILRRVAVLVIMGHLRAVHRLLGRPRSISIIDRSKWLEVRKTLYRSVTHDKDEVVRGHAKSVLESLEALQLEQLSNAYNDLSHIDSTKLKLNQLRGLALDPEARLTDGPAKIQVLQ